MNCKAVIGLGFGDEGKGFVTDYLCSKAHNPIVIRFSGGHQVGHTVIRNGVTHVFSNFGSGTLLGIPTYWSQYCTVEPIGLLHELSILLEKGANPLLYINKHCPVTTPFDILHNQQVEKLNNHGSCGVGFGSTLHRENQGYSLTFSDLFHPTILPLKLNTIKKFHNLDEEVDLDQFIDAIHSITHSEHVQITDSFPSKFESYIFEGAQGLLLDQSAGFFPHVTRSNTGSKNILNMGFTPEPYMVTRSYQTRHGNGPMTNEKRPHNIAINPTETNITNTYQGEFRRALLDLDLLLYAISKDSYIATNKENLVITCLDHIANEYRFTHNGHIIHAINEMDFVEKINAILGFKHVFISKSALAENGLIQIQ